MIVFAYFEFTSARELQSPQTGSATNVSAASQNTPAGLPSSTIRQAAPAVRHC